MLHFCVSTVLFASLICRTVELARYSAKLYLARLRTMGGKEVAKRIRRINKGKKIHEPVYDPELLSPDTDLEHT